MAGDDRFAREQCGGAGGPADLRERPQAKLRLAGLVRGRREGTFVHYSAADSHVRALLAEALFHADHTDRDLPDHPGGYLRQHHHHASTASGAV